MWWESVALARKAGLTFLSVLVRDPFLQSAGAALWLIFFTVLHTRAQPYAR